MSEQTKTGEYSGGVPWYPLRKWWQSGRLFNQDVGLPPFLEPGELQWMDVGRLQRSLAVCSWPGYIAPLFVPYISGSMRHPNQKISEPQYQWRVSLEVAHFFPSEISISVRDKFPDSCRASEAQAFLSAEDDGEEESPLKVHDDQAHPGSITAGLEQHEERSEQEEETQDKPDRESGPSAPIDGEGTESLQDSPKHHEAQEVLYTEASKQPENKGAVTDGEIQVLAGPGEAAEEISHPEEPEMDKSPLSMLPTQELETSNIEQEHTE